MYFTDRGIEELEARRGDDDFAVAWLTERMRDFVNLNPEFDVALDRFATWLARLDDEDEDLLPSRRASRASRARHFGIRPMAWSGFARGFHDRGLWGPISRPLKPTIMRRSAGADTTTRDTS